MATTSLWPIRNTGVRGIKQVVKKLVDYAENDEKTKGSGGTAGSSDKEVVRSVMGYAARDDKVNSEIPSSIDADTEENGVRHVLNLISEKNGEIRFVTGVNCSPERAVDEMMITKNRWPDHGNRLLYHGYQSFSPGEVTPEQAHRIGVTLARELWGDRFEVVVATHLDREHLHNHFVCNAISFLDGRKFIWDKEYPRMRKLSDELCRGERLSVVEEKKDMEMGIHRGASWADKQGKPTIQSIVKEDVDCCIRTASTLEEWISLMRGKGYRIDDSGKYFRVFPYGHSKCIRLDRRFGEEYSLDGIAKQIQEHGITSERTEKTEEEAIKEIYRELYRQGRRRHKSAGKPRGIQKRYIGFLFRIGYRKSPAQIARTHYLLREELTKLDRYIEESKFLIYEDIDTVDQLKERRSIDQAKMNMLYRSKKSLERMIPVSDDRERISAEGQLARIEKSIHKLQKCLRSEKGILKRMGEMDAKEKKLELSMSGKSLRKPYEKERHQPVHSKTSDQERGEIYG